jgi:hypothetical protein
MTMKRFSLALTALLLTLGLAGAATACSSTVAYPTPATWTVNYAGADYCGYIYDPHEVDMYGGPLTCRRAMFPSPVAVVVPGTLQWALLGYLEEYDGFFHSGYWYDQYYAPLGARYQVTVISKTVFTSNARTFEIKYGRDIRTRSAKANWRGAKTGTYQFPTSNSRARSKPLTNTNAGSTRYTGTGGAPVTNTRDSRIPTTSTRRASTSTGKSGTSGRRR